MSSFTNRFKNKLFEREERQMFLFTLTGVELKETNQLELQDLRFEANSWFLGWLFSTSPSFLYVVELSNRGFDSLAILLKIS